MKFKIMPVITIWDLTEALEAQYHWGLDEHELRELMFEQEYMNDCYKRYSFDEDAVCWGIEYEEVVRQENLLKGFLRDTFPEHSAVLVDVSW